MFSRTLATRIFGIDKRALAVFRIGMGLCVFYDLLARWSNIEAFYTDRGVLPRSVVIESFLSPESFSLYLLNGTEVWAKLLFVLTAVAALSFTLGYRTRLSGFVLWVLIRSLHVRNPLILYGVDAYIDVFLFWSLFLPLGAVWSHEANRAKLPKADFGVETSIATAAILLQLAAIYVGAALMKAHTPEWTTKANAIFLAFRTSVMPPPTDGWWSAYPRLERLVTHAVLSLKFWARYSYFFLGGESELSPRLCFSYFTF